MRSADVKGEAAQTQLPLLAGFIYGAQARLLHLILSGIRVFQATTARLSRLDSRPNHCQLRRLLYLTGGCAFLAAGIQPSSARDLSGAQQAALTSPPATTSCRS